MNNTSHIHVTFAIIERDGLVLASQRSAAMSMSLKWEFPGGKIDPGESPEACLRPLSPLTESCLFTGSPKELQLAHKLLDEMKSADSVDILVSFINGQDCAC